MQEQLKVRQAKVTKGKRRYLLTGFAKCLECGSAVVGSSFTKSYRYYRCNATTKTPMGRGSCRALSIPADDFEEVVWRRVSNAIQNPAVLVAELKSHFETGGGDIGQAMSKLKQEVRELKGQQRRLIELRQKDMVDQEILEGQLAPLKLLSDEKESDLRVLEAQLRQQGDIGEMERQIVEMCNNVSDKLDSMDFEGKRAALGAFGVKVVAARDSLAINLVVSPEFAAITTSSP